ncbi:MAG: terpene cyclase/mutase family protein [Planctomycetota bacterium]|nr:terpene cyclase/mutase family protein [Planctomycetota bacterium]
MRVLVWPGLILMLLLLALPAAQAGEGEQRHPASSAAEKALEALKLRMDARIKEGELLAKAGRIEEALEAYRSVGKLYEQGMAQIQRLIAGLGRVKQPVLNDRPWEGPPPDKAETDLGAFSGRSPARRGATHNAATAIELALAWLKAHQSPNGSWQAAGFADWCNGKPVPLGEAKPDGRGKEVYDVGVTGLALLAYAGAGHTYRGKGPYAETVAKGLRYLKTKQDAEGCIGARTNQHFIYNHGIATLALLESYGMTRSPIHQAACQKALNFISMAQNPYMGWRYGVRPGDNDTSVTVWMVMCLKSALVVNEADKRAGRDASFKLNPSAFAGAKNWIDKMTDPEYGRVGYNARGTGPARPQEMMDRFPADKSEAMTAAGICARIFMGEDPRKSALIRKGADLMAKKLPVWNRADGSIDMYYWYYGTLAMFQIGGKHWRDWSRALKANVVRQQRLDTTTCGVKGSWDPIGPWGPDGGRVYSTAMMALCLQTAFRYTRVFGSK